MQSQMIGMQSSLDRILSAIENQALVQGGPAYPPPGGPSRESPLCPGSCRRSATTSRCTGTRRATDRLVRVRSRPCRVLRYRSVRLCLLPCYQTYLVFGYIAAHVRDIWNHA